MKRLTSILEKLRAIIGVPDYDRYVEHCRLHHPDAELMTRDQFVSERMQRKYSTPGTRCC
ncbi:MAG TPA: YbdD/YjiX family protein [Gemmatimonadaceae bacterium]|nr:YbdD/YjiX family protein [Gemmatimonadaceae bacterium]